MTKTRRRGAELEAAIYQATRDILKSDGLSQLTFSTVADVAGTSKPVLYRRWDSPFSLALAAIQDQIKRENHGRLDEVVLTGTSLREDLFQTLQRFIISMDTFGQTFVSTWLGDLDTNKSNQIQDMINDAKKIDIHAIDRILQRATDRGEIKTTEMSADMKLMPFDWLRYQMFMNEPINNEKLTMLVDDFLMPAYLRHQTL